MSFWFDNHKGVETLFGVIGHAYTGELIDISIFENLMNFDETEKISEDETEIELRTNVTHFEKKNKRCDFVILVDYKFKVPYRDQYQLMKKTAGLEIKVFTTGEDLELYSFGSKADSKIVVEKIREILNLDKDWINHIQISPKKVLKIIVDDSNNLKGGWWKDLDDDTIKGYLKGNLDRSKYRVDFDKNGECSSATFESRHLNGITVRVTSNGSVTVWGKGTTASEVMDYFNNKVKPILKGE